MVYLDFNEIEIGNSYEKTVNNIEKFFVIFITNIKELKLEV